MDLQYISDSNGKHTAVIIPIDEWNNITTKHQDLKTLDEPKKNPQISEAVFLQKRLTS